MTSLRGTGAATSSSTPGSVVVPMPSGIQFGDLILIYGSSLSATLGTLAGFTSTANTATGNQNGRAYVRTADGTESGIGSFTITLGSSSFLAAAICAVYAGPASIDPASIPAVYVNSNDATSLAVPAITLANSGGTDWLAWFGAGSNSGSLTGTLTGPSGFTAQNTITHTQNGTDTILMTFADLETGQASGSTGTKTGTFSSAIYHMTGWMAGVNPAAAAASNASAFMGALP